MKKIVSLILVVAILSVAMAIPAFADAATPRYSVTPCPKCGGEMVFYKYIPIINADGSQGTGVVTICTKCHTTQYAGSI